MTISPSNQDAWFGLAEATFLQDRPEDADELYRKAIEIEANSEIAELARGRLSEIAQKIFRSKMPGVERMDAVMYLVGAMDKFEGMPRQEVQKIGVEIAMLGTRGSMSTIQARNTSFAACRGDSVACTWSA